MNFWCALLDELQAARFEGRSGLESHHRAAVDELKDGPKGRQEGIQCGFSALRLCEAITPDGHAPPIVGAEEIKK